MATLMKQVSKGSFFSLIREHTNSLFSFSFELVGMISLDENDREVINLLFVLPGSYLK